MAIMNMLHFGNSFQTSFVRNENRLKLRSIPHPTLRFALRLINMTFHAQGEPTNLGKKELKML